MKKRLLSGALLLLFMGGLGACTTNKEETSNKDQDKIQIMTSFYPMYDFTKKIVGDEADVEMLISAGVEAHDYEPSAKDLKKLQDSDVFVYNNENMETWVSSVETTLKEGKVETIKASEKLVLLPGTDHGHSHGEHDEEAHEESDHDHDHEGHGHSHAFDPHVWLAPSLAIKEVEEISEQLIKAYPDKKEVFTKNTEDYLEKLHALDQAYQTTLKSSGEPKSFVTQHAAFGYLALEYGLNQVPIAGLTPEEEPSPARLAKLKKYVKENNIEYIYFESNTQDGIAQTLAKEAGVELLVLNTLESLTTKEIESGKDYVSIMTDNLEALSKTVSSENQVTIKEHHEVEKTAQNGYFEDKEIEDRPLSNWNGNWQSVYPYVLDGSLDQVFDVKAKLNKDKSAEAYKEYYEAGYKTDIESIQIKGDKITYTDAKGNEFGSEYKYAGYHILNYDKGNRGVRYLFEAKDPDSGAFKYIQFSDHTITDTTVEHYHLYFGNERQEALFKQLDNWPTYYSSELSGKEIAQEMLVH